MLSRRWSHFCAWIVLSIFFSFCSPKKPSAAPEKLSAIFVSTSSRKNPLVQQWLQQIVQPSLSSLESLKTNCIEASKLLTLEWSQAELDCNQILNLQPNATIKGAECLGPKLLQLKLSSCNESKIQHELYKIRLPKSQAIYQQKTATSLIPVVASNPTIWLEPPSETALTLEPLDLKDWLKTSFQSDLVNLSIQLEEEAKVQQWQALLEFLKAGSTPKLLLLQSQVWNLPQNKILEDKTTSLLFPIMEATNASFQPICNYLQNSIRSQLILQMKKSEEARETIRLSCHLGLEYPSPDAFIFAKLALPLMEASAGVVPIRYQADLNNPQSLRELLNRAP